MWQRNNQAACHFDEWSEEKSFTTRKIPPSGRNDAFVVT
jgi:hypothetical protein